MSQQRKILIIEDQKRERDALSRVLRMEGYAPVAVAGIGELRAHLSEAFDLAICDLRLGIDSGLDALHMMRDHWHGMPVIMVTAYGAIDSAVNAMKLGAIDYLTKPLKPTELLALLNRYLPMERKEALTPHNTTGLEKQLGNSSIMSALYSQVASLAQTNRPILVAGEQGAGHELVAAAVHEQSSRRSRPYVEFRPSAFLASAIEGELFGHGRTDYTSRTKANKGRMAQAAGGTIYIEECFALPLATQQRLFDCLMGTGKRSESGKEIDVRIITGISVPIADLHELENVHVDLLGTLQSNKLELPALREHPEDIPALVDYYLAECSRHHLRTRPVLDDALLNFMYSYEWPGNVRQLRNAIENMLVLSPHDQISMNELTAFLGGGHLAESTALSTSEMSLNDLERIAVIGALKRSHGNKTHASQKLGISVRTLQRKMKQWKLEGGESDA